MWWRLGVLFAAAFLVLFVWQGENGLSWTLASPPFHYPAPYSIFILKTSPDPPRHYELCTAYSAAQHNPNAIVNFIWVNYSSSAQFPSYLNRLPNFRPQLLNFSQEFQGTPMEKWFTSQVWNVSAVVKRARFLSDAVRMAHVWKNGGLYIDTDFITLKNLESLSNVVAKQSENEINNDFFHFPAGAAFPRRVMERVAKEFKPRDSEIFYGPLMVTKVLKKMRAENGSVDLPSVLDVRYVHPFPYGRAELLYGPKASLTPSYLNWTAAAFGVHLWHNKIRGHNPTLRPPKDSLLREIIQTHCAPVLPLWLT